MNQTSAWVFVVQNTASFNYQILDETVPKTCGRAPRILQKLLVFACKLYGIPLPTGYT